MSEPERAAIEAEETDRLAPLRRQAEAEIAGAADLPALEAVRVRLFGKASELARLMKEVGGLPPAERAARAAIRNQLRGALTGWFDARKAVLEAAGLAAALAAERIDISAPPRADGQGAIHPISRSLEELAAIFGAMGFSVREGPDIEDDWFNFSALNIPAHHPARAMMDTFYLRAEAGAAESAAAEPVDARPAVLRTVASPVLRAVTSPVLRTVTSQVLRTVTSRVLRTHTSPVQIRTMLDWARRRAAGEDPPPIRIIVPGRTFRADHDATHSPMFHQVEGLVIGRDITLGHLKGCLIDFLRAYFGSPDLPVRFRASYFPFTEPSMEVDIGWNRKTGEIGAGDHWLEILGSGMVHPNVLANCGIDPREFQGFAFGVGIERITMLKHGIADLRLFYESDLRWLRHYGTSPLAPAMLHEGF